MASRVRTALWLLLPAVVLCASIWLARAAPRERRASPVPPLPAGQGFPVRVELSAGRALTIERAPRRLVLANSNMVDMVTRLVPAERVLALPEQALTWSRLVDVDEGFRAKATFRRVDSELVLQLAPDLVLCSPFNSALMSEQSAALPLLSLPQPRDLDELHRIVTLLGRVLGVEERSRELLADVDRRVAALRASAPRRAGLGAVSYSNFGGSGWSAGAGTMTDELLRLAGLRNLTAEVGGARGEVRMTFEDLVAYDPDVIVLPARFGEASSGTEAVLRGEPSLAGVAAVHKGMLVRLHPRFFSSGSQEIVAGAEVVARAVDRALERRGENR